MAAVLRTHVGLVRKQNEDAAWYDDTYRIYAVADGMGGHLAGEVASGIAIETVQKIAKSGVRPGVAMLREMAAKAHEEIFAHAKQNPQCEGMGTTFSVMWQSGRYAYIAHVGDSRIYRLRNGNLEQITHDHSLVEELVRARIITKEAAKTHPRRNVITRALGSSGENSPDLLAADVCEGDIWLLCSDGLTGMVEDEEICRTMLEYPLDAAADRLIDLALKAGGKDNVTLILYRCEEG